MDHIQPKAFHYKQNLRGTPTGTPLTSQFILLSSSGVAAVAEDSFGAAVATMHLPFRICRRRILLEASSAELRPMGSAIIPSTKHATFLSSLGLCFGSFRHVASPGKFRRGRYPSPNGYGISSEMNYRTVKQTSAHTMIGALIVHRPCE